jgi:ABC-type multidrug transport system fused ATPase/permease subunit
MVGLALVALAASLISGNTNLSQGPIGTALDLLHSIGLVNDYASVGLGAALFFILKALLSIWLNNLNSTFLARTESGTAVQLFSKLMQTNFTAIGKWNEHEIILALNDSVYIAYNYALMASAVVFGEATLIASISIFLFLESPWLFVLMALYFGGFAVAINVTVYRKTRLVAGDMTNSTLRSQSLVADALALLRQSKVIGTGQSFSAAFSAVRVRKANGQAQLNKLTYLPRYVVETALMVGIALILLQRSIDGGTGLAASTVAVFLAGAFRLIASLLPLQASYAALKSIDLTAKHALDLRDNLDLNGDAQPKPRPENYSRSLDIAFANASFTYSGSQLELFSNLSLKIPQGQNVAIVGRSGSGKSTFTDLLLGFQVPSNGNITIGGLTPDEFITQNPGAIAYVPQKSHIMHGTLLENLLLEFDPVDFDFERLELVIKWVHLSDWVESLPEGLETHLGSGARELSGGQMQRLGLARALYRDAKILILDEVTSALDRKTAEAIHRLIVEHSSGKTVITITHKLENLKDYDRVISIDNGNLQEL